jgi:hypothetical protein
LLAKIGRLDLLCQLYDEVIVPVSVLDEIAAKRGQETGQIRAFVQSRKFRLRRGTKRALKGLPADLGAGEREAIALAVARRADLVILDDQQGRRVARGRDLAVTGTIGILLEARARGLISSVRHELGRLVEAGLWIEEAFYHRILQEFGE